MSARNEADEKNVLRHLIFLALSLVQAYNQTLLFPFPVFKNLPKALTWAMKISHQRCRKEVLENEIA